MQKTKWLGNVGTAVLCAAAVACTSAGRPTAADPPFTSTPIDPSLPAGVYALAGVAPQLPITDLAPFRAIIGTAKFVALGESTHTSAGYYQAKARLIRYMVEELGFRVVAFETPWLQALPAKRYVASCVGTPEAAMSGMFGVWHDPSVRDLLHWLCEYNRAHPADPVTFFGFDIQEPWMSAPAIKEFVARAAPTQVARTEPLFRCLGANHGTMNVAYLSTEFREHSAGRRNTANHDACMNGIAAVESWITELAKTLDPTAWRTAIEEARISLIALRAFEDQLWIPDPGGYQGRDSGMAQALLRLHALYAPGKRVAVWAWNWHIARRYEEVRGFDGDSLKNVPRQGARAMGGFLTDALGADYRPIALIGYRVEINSGGIKPPIPESPLAVEKRLNDLDRDYLLVDLRKPLPNSFLRAGPRYQVSQEWGDPYRQFDALLYLRHSPPMTYVQVPR